jgi:hypothetical protein
MNVKWPNGHKFAFSVVDDTDSATIENVKPVYDLLAELGMKTTKTAWMFRGDGAPTDCGTTCEEPEYLDWLLSLQQQGFEIAFHNAAPCTSSREETRVALARFRELFGTKDILFCNHGGCEQNIYWGSARLSEWRRVLYNFVTRGKKKNSFRGHIEGDPLFWGDLCQQHVRYVRNFVFDELDALTVCPEQPYHDPSRPYVNFWFTSADGMNLKAFLKNITVEKLKRLERAGGACIVYVHFAYGFVENGKVNSELERRFEFLTTLNGWFAPASEILDYLRQGAGVRERTITPNRLRQLEKQWLFEKLLKGTT